MSSDGGSALTADGLNERLFEYLERTAQLRLEQAREHAVLAQQFRDHLEEHRVRSDRIWKALFVVLTVALGLAARVLFK